ncbi:MAG TPA: alpha/beta fold hydrolase [Oculatellaceae cyanobacterium]
MECEPLNPGLFFKNPHLMTIAAALWPRGRSGQPNSRFRQRYFQLAPDVQLLAECHIESKHADHPTLVIVHGLEGSSRSPDILNLSTKAIAAEMNVVCLNLRNCGDTLHLCPNLYNGGMSEDVLKVLEELRTVDKLTNIFLVGYSLGGNIVLKLGGELSSRAVHLMRGICAISPAVDLDACVTAIEQGLNRFYEQRFLIGLKDKIRQKARLFPGKYSIEKLNLVRKIRDFDDTFTAPDGGYSSAADYYAKCSSLHVLDKIAVPTLIITAKDDPLVPFNIFSSEKLNNPNIRLLAPEHGGHGGFLNCSPTSRDSDIFWAENRVIQFCDAGSRD